MTAIRLGPHLTVPDDAVTNSFALLGKRGTGKSNAAVVMAEAMHDANYPWVAIDPKGDWWGMRSDAKGTGPGLAIPVLGGLHGDIPLAPDAGNLIADLIVDQDLTVILDVSEFDSKADQARFLTDLALRLFRRHGADPHPRHLFLEEADEFVPQRVHASIARCVGAWSKVVKQGRSRGLGITLITQRSAVVNKDALTQTETLIAFRTTAPHDRKAIEAWVIDHDAARDVLDTLPTLEDGEAWIVSPHYLDMTQRRRFRRRATFDSGATPVTTGKRKSAAMADLDLDDLAETMAGLIEDAEARDPDRLLERIAALEAERGQVTVDQVTEYVNVVPPAVVKATNVIRDAAETAIRALEDATDRAAEVLAAETEKALEGFRDAFDGYDTVVDADLGTGWEIDADAPVTAPERPSAPQEGAERPRAPAKPAKLSRQAQKMLDTLVGRHPVTLSDQQLATMSGYSIRSSSFPKAIRELTEAGAIVLDITDGWAPTPHGVELARVAPASIPADPAALLDLWASKLDPQPRAFLLEIAKCGRTSEEHLAEATGYSLTSSSFPKSLRELDRLGLVTRPALVTWEIVSWLAT